MNKINGISHITLICENLDKSAALFHHLFEAIEVYSSDEKCFSISKEKFFLIGNLWIALMEGKSIERSYNHIAFHINEEDLPLFENKIKVLGLDIAPSRSRQSGEGRSIYFYDYDNHLFELHTGDLAKRLEYYQNPLKLRIAKKTELEWINSCYDQIDFVHSHFDNEIIAIAEFNGQKAGLGRLVTIDEQNLELGGMYVIEQFRNKGIAKEIVKFLLSHVHLFQRVYCIPFEHLLEFYRQAGFVTCSNFEPIPLKILDKFKWCQEKYTDPTALLLLDKNA